MRIELLTLHFHAGWVRSIKEKRMVVQSILSKMRSRYNASVVESGEQDIHQSIVISAAFLAASAAQADSIAEQILRFAETASDAELIRVQR